MEKDLMNYQKRERYQSGDWIYWAVIFIGMFGIMSLWWFDITL